MRGDCEICCGSGRVRLPIYRMASAIRIDPLPAIEESSREYPCPECGDLVPQDRVAVLQCVSTVDSRHEGNPDYMQTVRKHAAHSLVEELLKGGFIRVERGPTRDGFIFKTRATLAAISQTHVATMEERIAERQDQVAQEVVEVAAAESRHWRSYWGDAQVDKSKVLEYLRDAVKCALERRARMRTI